MRSRTVSIPEIIDKQIQGTAYDEQISYSHALVRYLALLFESDAKKYDQAMRKPRKDSLPTQPDKSVAQLKLRPIPRSLEDLRANPRLIEMYYNIILRPGACWNRPEEPRERCLITAEEREEIAIMKGQYALPYYVDK